MKTVSLDSPTVESLLLVALTSLADTARILAAAVTEKSDRVALAAGEIATVLRQSNVARPAATEEPEAAEEAPAAEAPVEATGAPVAEVVVRPAVAQFTETGELQAPVKRRGRPAGSKNRSKEDEAKETTSEAEAAPVASTPPSPENADTDPFPDAPAAPALRPVLVSVNDLPEESADDLELAFGEPAPVEKVWTEREATEAAMKRLNEVNTAEEKARIRELIASFHPENRPTFRGMPAERIPELMRKLAA